MVADMNWDAPLSSLIVRSVRLWQRFVPSGKSRAAGRPLLLSEPREEAGGPLWAVIRVRLQGGRGRGGLQLTSPAARCSAGPEGGCGLGRSESCRRNTAPRELRLNVWGNKRWPLHPEEDFDLSVQYRSLRKRARWVGIHTHFKLFITFYYTGKAYSLLKKLKNNRR